MHFQNFVENEDRSPTSGGICPGPIPCVAFGGAPCAPSPVNHPKPEKQTTPVIITTANFFVFAVCQKQFDSPFISATAKGWIFISQMLLI